MFVAVMSAALLIANAARADHDGRVVGNWITTAKEDPFGDGGIYTAVAINDGYAFGVRCMNKTFSYAVISIGDKTREGSAYKFKFRVDRGKVYQGGGLAVGEKMVQIFAERGLAKDLTDGRELAIRQEVAGITETHVIKLRGASKALAGVFSNCPPDKQPDIAFDEDGSLTSESIKKLK